MLSDSKNNDDLTIEQKRAVELRKATIIGERRLRDGTAGIACVVDHKGKVVKRFRIIHEAQSYISNQPQPDQFGIEFYDKHIEAFGLKRIVDELAQAGETESEVAAEQSCDRHVRYE